MSTAARRRLRESIIYLVTEHGYDAVDLDAVLERAGVGRDEFKRLYPSKEGLAMDAFDAVFGDYERKVMAAFEVGAEWPGSLRAAAYAVADWMSEHPREARYGTVEMLWAGEMAQVRREEAFAKFVSLVDAGREVAADPDSIPPHTALAVIGSLADMFTKRLGQPDFDLYETLPQMMYLAVRPYLGEEPAARELTMPRPGYRPRVAKRKPRGEEPGQPLTRLPRGRHGLPRELVTENQRRRLIGGIIEAVAEHGYGATTITQITAAAQLSRRTFYEHFKNKEDCFAAAYEAIFAYLRGALGEAIGGPEEWSKRVRAGLAALLETFATHPAMARFFLIGPPGAGDAIAARHHQAMRELVGELTAGAPSPVGGAALSEAGEQALAGGISRLIVHKLSAGEAAALPELAPALSELVLRPYIGGEGAARIAGAC